MRLPPQWSLGCVVYELCTLEHAFAADSLLSLVYKIVQGRTAPLPEGRYSALVSGTVERLLQQDPADRPAATELLADPGLEREFRRIEAAVLAADPDGGGHLSAAAFDGATSQVLTPREMLRARRRADGQLRRMELEARALHAAADEKEFPTHLAASRIPVLVTFGDHRVAVGSTTTRPRANVPVESNAAEADAEAEADGASALNSTFKSARSSRSRRSGANSTKYSTKNSTKNSTRASSNSTRSTYAEGYLSAASDLDAALQADAGADEATDVYASSESVPDFNLTRRLDAAQLLGPAGFRRDSLGDLDEAAEWVGGHLLPPENYDREAGEGGWALEAAVANVPDPSPTPENYDDRDLDLDLRGLGRPHYDRDPGAPATASLREDRAANLRERCRRALGPAAFAAAYTFLRDGEFGGSSIWRLRD